MSEVNYKKRMQRKKEYIDSRIDQANIDKGGSPRSLRNTHRESVSGCVGFRLGFVYHSPRSAGSGLFQSA